MSKVFLTGATGYIGGEVLYQLLKAGGFQITGLVRNAEKAKLLPKEVKVVSGTLDDLHLIQEQVTADDIIVNAANTSHTPSAKAIAETLVASKMPEILIQTSGTSVLGGKVAAQRESPKIYMTTSLLITSIVCL